MKYFFFLFVMLLLSFTPQLRAAFVITPVPATQIAAQSTTPPDNSSTLAKAHKHSHDVASFLFGIAGLITATIAIMLIGTALSGVIALGILTILLGLVAVSFAIKHTGNIQPHGWLAVTGFVLGIIEAIPIILRLVIMRYGMCMHSPVKKQ